MATTTQYDAVLLQIFATVTSKQQMMHFQLLHAFADQSKRLSQAVSKNRRPSKDSNSFAVFSILEAISSSLRRSFVLYCLSRRPRGYLLSLKRQF
jgi:hypothetical protein